MEAIIPVCAVCNRGCTWLAMANAARKCVRSSTIHAGPQARAQTKRKGLQGMAFWWHSGALAALVTEGPKNVICSLPPPPPFRESIRDKQHNAWGVQACLSATTRH